MADSKTTALTELTAFDGDEEFYVVDDDDGTPVSKRVTIENLTTEVTDGIADSIANGDASTLTSAQTYADGKVSDTAYNAGTWDAVTGVAPSKNAVRDKIELLAPLASPALTGHPTGVTESAGDNSTRLATTAYVDTADGLLVPKSLFDANTILAATTDNTPAALTVGASTFVGRKASGNIAAMTPAEAAALLAGAVGGPPLVVRKTADESVTSSTTGQADDHLLFAVGASQVWHVEIAGYYTGATGGDISIVLDGPASSSFIGGSVGLDLTATGQTGSLYAPAFSWSPGAAGWPHGAAGSGTLCSFHLTAQVTTSATTGNVTLVWAQGTSSGTATTLKAGSVLKAYRLA